MHGLKIFSDSPSDYLRSTGREVFSLQKFTDFNDRIFNYVQAGEVLTGALAHRVDRRSRNDMQVVGIDAVSTPVRASLHREEINRQADRLIRRDLDRTENGLLQH